MEIYVIQILIQYFIERDEEQCKILIDKIIGSMNQTPLCTPELIVIVHTILGMLSEGKALLEAEQNYMMAILSIHKLFGDPRGRGAIGVPWELFLCWRLSIITRLQGKIHDAEYVEELFDATALSISENKLNKFKKSHYVYEEPFKVFDPQYDKKKDIPDIPKPTSTQQQNTTKITNRYLREK